MVTVNSSSHTPKGSKGFQHIRKVSYYYFSSIKIFIRNEISIIKNTVSINACKTHLDEILFYEICFRLGCVHDGSPPPTYLGGPGASRCPWEDGFIMSDLRHTDRGFRWSSCSVEQFKHFLKLVRFSFVSVI